LSRRHVKEFKEEAFAEMRKVNPSRFSSLVRKVVSEIESAITKEFASFQFGSVQTKLKDFSTAPGIKDLCQLHEYRGTFRRQKNEGFDVCVTFVVPGTGVLAFTPSGGVRKVSFIVTTPDNPATGCITTLLAIPCIGGVFTILGLLGMPPVPALILGFGLGCCLAVGLGYGFAKLSEDSKWKDSDRLSKADAIAAFNLGEPMFSELHSEIIRAAKPPTEYESRIWTSTKSGSPIEAVFLRTDATAVYLRKNDGTLVKLAKENLAADDENYLANLEK
jgi:hypothetical protein